MTSKEALEKLHNLELWNGELECYSDLYTLKPELFKVIEKDLEVLEKYRELFELIIKQDLNLEYTGHELKHYHDVIEEKNNEKI